AFTEPRAGSKPRHRTNLAGGGARALVDLPVSRRSLATGRNPAATRGSRGHGRGFSAGHSQGNEGGPMGVPRGPDPGVGTPDVSSVGDSGRPSTSRSHVGGIGASARGSAVP